MLLKAKDNFLAIKYLFFIVFLFPFLMHIYWGVFDILYANNIIYISVFLLVILLFLNYYQNAPKYKDEKIIFIVYSVFLFLFLINSFILNDYKYFIKYFIYIILFIYLFSMFRCNKYYKLYINVVTFFVVINLLLYFYYIVFSVPLYFKAENLSLLTIDNSFLLRKDWNYAIPFYLLVIPINSFGDAQIGFLGLPRLFGMSTEPTLYSVVLLPTFFMAIYFKKYMQSIILFLGLLFSSSYGAFLALLIGIMFYSFYRYKMILFYSFFILFILGYYLGFYEYALSLSPRLHLYGGLILNIFNISNISFLANLNFQNLEELKLPSALLTQSLKYGILLGFSYCFIFYIYMKFALYVKSKILFAFTVVSLLMINKSGEILSPLFLFYFNFVYSQYLNFKKNNVSIGKK